MKVPREGGRRGNHLLDQNSRQPEVSIEVSLTFISLLGDVSVLWLASELWCQSW